MAKLHKLRLVLAHVPDAERNNTPYTDRHTVWYRLFAIKREARERLAQRRKEEQAQDAA